jgi:hypothetical protein
LKNIVAQAKNKKKDNIVAVLDLIEKKDGTNPQNQISKNQ